MNSVLVELGPLDKSQECSSRRDEWETEDQHMGTPCTWPLDWMDRGLLDPPV